MQGCPWRRAVGPCDEPTDRRGGQPILDALRVVMLNLLKFRGRANYPAGSPHAPCSGTEAYRRYQTAFVETVGDVSRAELVWKGQVDMPFIGDAAQDWDKCLLARYPSRQNFLSMMANAAYRGALVHRYAGLERTTLLQMQG
jgi:hypothetical protein